MGKGGKAGTSYSVCISKSEVRKHCTRDDNWLIVDDNVYNVTEWRLSHPGGAKLLTHYAGQDASEAFHAFHWDEGFVGKYMKALKVGELESVSGAVTRHSQTEKETEQEIKQDFETLRQTVEKMGMFRPSTFFFVFMLGHILLLEVLAYCVMWHFGTGWLPWMVSALACATAQAQGGWLQHDFGHLSVFKSRRLNHFLHVFIMNHLKGASASWWNHMHYQHHAKPNCMNKDPDVRLETLFVVGEEMPKIVAKEKKSSMPYNYQHHYFYIIGPPLLFPLYFQLMVFRHAITRRQWMDFAVMLSFYIKFLALYVPFLGVAGTVLFYLLIRSMESAWFVWVSQSNHIVMEIDEDKERPWLPLQLHATCNINKTVFNDWFTGHLNHQIEHHLFPLMPRHNLYKITTLVKAICKKHSIPYICKPLSTAFADILRSLEHSGQLWDAYYHAFHCE